MTRYRTSRLAAAVLLGATALAYTEWRPEASGTISGVVFEDFNGNGLRDTSTTIPNNGLGSVSTAVDRGVGGVTVTVFDGAGVLQGSATSSAANGTYSIAATGIGPYRVEFTSLPAGYFPSKFATGATGNGTTVQFVPDGNSANINLAILDPANYCQNNPSFVISCYVFGDQVTGPNALMPTVVDFPYSAGSTGPGATAYFQPTTHNLMATAQNVGTTYGMAYNRQANRLYTSAFMKKHAGFGPSGTGAIYAIDPTQLPGGAPVLFADLNTLFGGAGPDLHNPADYNTDNGNTTWDAVGKLSLGGLEASPDGAFVYVVNLFDRHVYRIPTGAGTAQRVPIPVPASAVPASGADLRPFALQYYKGLLYVGMVNSAESTQNAANLRAYVYALDPASLVFSAAPVFEFSLQYPRGAVQLFDSVSPGAWLPWRSTFATNWPGVPGGVDNVGTYPQPMLTGLSFDVDGNMTIGLRDRAGDQFGYYALSNPADSLLWLGVAGGDTLIAQGNPASGWTLESNAQTTSFGPTGGVGNNQGPGGGEYFFHDNFVDPLNPPAEYHQELNQGAVLQLPGFPDVMTSSMNPGESTNAGGIMWLSRLAGVTEGTSTKGYNLYATPQGPPSQFAKTNGLGEFMAICQAAPIEIGNRVWDDIDGDGIQDANEAGLDGVTVQLIAPGGALLASVVTANGGQYYFSSETIAGLVPNTTGYIVRIAVAQGALGGRTLTIANSDGSANGDSRDSDGTLVTGNAEVVVNTGAAGNNNHTYDFGFTTAAPPALTIGNFVWYDTNDNGAVDGAEVGISGVDVVLYRDNGNGTFDATTDTLVAAQQTAAGLYLFTGLPPGNYFVQIPANEFGSGQTLFGYQNSTGQTAGDLNDRDHGAAAPLPGQGIVSDLVTLTLFGEPVNDGDTDPNTNLTIDFGFYKLSLGNFVFFDANNNGVVNAGDTPAAGVPVELLDASGTTVLQATATDAVGIYGFSGLLAGDYRVRITPPTGFTSSTGAANAFEPGPDPDNNVDNDDNGTNSGGTITSLAVTLTPGAEPIVTNANGETANPTVDFGLIQVPGMSLGNLVWRDNNNDGLVSAGEPGIDGVTVRLFNGTGTVQLNQMTTAGGGFYLFTGLAPGDYVVEVVIPPGLTSSTGTGNAYEPAPDPDNDVDNDDNGTTQGLVVRSLPVTLTLNSEPVNDGDTDPNSNLTIDFGFFSQSLCLGNLVWFDVNNNGVVDAGEVGIPGVTLRLIGADGITVIATTVTDANGNYLFCGLAAGTYSVEVDRTSPPISGVPSSTDIGSSANPDNDVDNDDNGVNVTTTTVRSNPVTLTFGGEPINDGDTDPNTNLTIDFGFVPPQGVVSLGNLVWWDGNENSLADVGEIGLQGVTVRLIAANGTTVLATQTTNASGNYLFANLQPGTYFVEVDAPVLGTSRPSSNDISSTSTPNNDLDNDDNGIGVSGTVFRSGPATLTVGGEPINDGDGNPNSNLTVDFGFVPDPGNFQASMCLQQQIPLAIAQGSQFVASYSTDNAGPGVAFDVMIEGMLPPGISVVSTNPSPGGACTVTAGLLDCRWPGPTQPGPAGMRRVDVTFQASPALPVGTAVQLWFMSMFNNQDMAGVDCSMVDGYPFIVAAGSPTADLAITGNATSSMQSGTAIPAPLNQPVATSFSITNTGTIPASGIYTIFLDNPAGLSLQNATVSQGSIAALTAMSGNWDTGNIAPGATATLGMTFVPQTSGVTKASAIRYFGTPGDPNAANDSAVFVIDAIGPGGGRNVATGNVDGVAGDEIVTGTGVGEGPQVRVFAGNGSPLLSFYAFQRAFLTGVRVATCDINADGFEEIIAGQGPGGGRVNVVSLKGGYMSNMVAFDAFEPGFTGGVNVACADVDNDGRGEVIVAPEGGRAPDVRIYDVDVALAVMAAQFQAYEPSFLGGVRVAAANFGGSALLGAFHIATMPGAGRPGEVRTWLVGSGSASMVAGATVLPATGSRVALGDANGDGGLDLLFMPDGGVPSLLSVFSLTNGALLFSAPSGAAGIHSLDATVGVLTGGPGSEVIVGRGPGESPDIISFTIGAGGAVVPRLIFTALEVP